MSFTDGIGAHIAAQDVEEARRVNINSGGEMVYATATELGIGTVKFEDKLGEAIAVIYFNKPGTQHMVAAEAIGVGVEVYAAASGKISLLPVAAGDYVKVGVTLEAAEDDGDIIEVLPVESGKLVNVAA